MVGLRDGERRGEGGATMQKTDCTLIAIAPVNIGIKRSIHGTLP
jgi:hypothetical protein